MIDLPLQRTEDIVKSTSNLCEEYIEGMDVWGPGLARKKAVDSLSVFFLTIAALMV